LLGCVALCSLCLQPDLFEDSILYEAKSTAKAGLAI
jgi:hypothetical protein